MKRISFPEVMMEFGPEAEQFTLEWRGIELRIMHENDGESSHLSVEAIHPKHAPLSIAATGYRHYWMREADVKAYGGPVAVVRAWLDQESQ